MKARIYAVLLTLAALVVQGCVAAPSTSDEKRTTAATGWYPGEEIVTTRDYLNLDRMENHREGRLPNGYFYRIFSDGSGSVRVTDDILADSWDVSCKLDPITDRRNCHVSGGTGSPFVYFGTSTQPQQVCILGHDFPGRQGAIRVDKRPPVTTDEDGCVGGGIVRALASGAEVITRRYEWPYDYSQDKTTSLEGFDESIFLMNYIRDNIGKISF